jgi:hypothetical protein
LETQIANLSLAHIILPNIAIGLSHQPLLLGLRILLCKELKNCVVITDAIQYVQSQMDQLSTAEKKVLQRYQRIQRKTKCNKKEEDEDK